MHKVQLIEKKPLSNGQLAYKLRCCNNESTDSWHTLTVTPGMTAEDISAEVEEKKQLCSQQHSAMITASSALDLL
jgi:hypothetical protein